MMSGKICWILNKTLLQMKNWNFFSLESVVYHNKRKNHNKNLDIPLIGSQLLGIPNEKKYSCLTRFFLLVVEGYTTSLAPISHTCKQTM